MKASIDTFEPPMQYMLYEMCRRVGADPEKVDFSDDEWYLAYSWTPTQQEEYTEWLADYLYKHAAARKLFRYCQKTRRDTKQTATTFCAFYSWTYNG